MGQSASTQREEFNNRDSRRLSQLLDRDVRERSMSGRPTTRAWATGRQMTDQSNSASSLGPTPTQDSHSSQPIATFSRQISTQSVPILGGGAGGNSTDISTRDDVFYERHEERASTQMEDMDDRDGQITHITASPMPRRSSRISRLSSMVMPRYTTNEASGDGEQDPGVGRSWRRRLSNTDPTRTSPNTQGQSSHRLSLFGSFTPRSSTSPRSRRPRERASISRPFPLSPDASLPPSGFATSPLREAPPTTVTRTAPHDPPSRLWSIRDGSRLARVRRSISSPFESLLPTPQRSQAPISTTQAPPQRPQRLTPTHDPDFRLPSLDGTDTGGETASLEPDPMLSMNRERRFSAIPTVSESPERTVSRVDVPTWAERWAERGSVGRREGRRMPTMLRGRSSRLIRRDNEGPLPRILHLAATAIAAQLSGTPEQPPDMQAIGHDDLDGSLQNLFRTLQNASTMTGETRPHDDNDTTRPPGTLPPLNFLRVFRFVSQSSNTAAQPSDGAGGRARAEHSSGTNEDTPDDQDSRTVTLVVVGVRSVPSDRIGQEDTAAAEPSLDALLNLPALAPSANVLRNGAGSLLRHANGRSRFPNRRRASIPGIATFPANYDSQRHQRTLSASSHQGSSDATPATGTATPLVISESPPGPHPPPSTPAEPGLSAYSSAATTPSRRPSSASAIQQPPIPNRDVATQNLREAGILPPDDQPSRVQQRRRSDSEFARHRDLGLGAARRNGVVEPDEVDTGESPASGSRSWLIYVVGTNLSEDHPALTTPSLFTDVCDTSRFPSHFLVLILMQTSSRIPLMKTCCYSHPF